MQDLISNPEPTMSSREIADLLGVRHDTVKRTINRLATPKTDKDGIVVDEAVICLPPMVEYLDSLSRPAHEYRIGKRDSYIIVAQLSPEFTAILVDRWQELEAQQATPDPSKLSRIQILQMAMESEQERIRLEEKVKQDAPKVEFVDRYTDSTGLVSLTQAAKDLQFPPRKFIKYLEDNSYLYRTGGSLTPYQRYINEGLFQMVVGEKGGHGYSQTKITTKGKTVFAQRFASELM